MTKSVTGQIMYDSLGMYLENSYLKEGLLSNLSEIYSKETGELTIRGNLENLKLKQSGNIVSVFGSLPKYYFGDNLQQLTRKDTQLAIEKISDNLNLSLVGSKIFRLDIGANFILNLPLQNYFSCLGDLSRFKKSQIANRQALLYTTTTKALEFYDKPKELRRSRQVIPELFNGRHVLRYELHLTKNISDSLKCPELRAKHLYEEKFYIQGINFWKDFYFSIQRINRINFIIGSVKMINAKSLKNQLALIGLKTIGEDQLLEMIEANKKEIGHRKQVSRMKELVRSLSNEPELTEPNEAIKELDTKILRIAKSYR